MSPPSSDSSSSSPAVAAESSDSKKTAWSRVGNGAPVTNEPSHVMGADSWPALGESAPKSSPKSDGSGSSANLDPIAANDQIKVDNPNPNPNLGKPKRNGGPVSPPLPSVDIPQKISNDKPVGHVQESSYRDMNSSTSMGTMFSPNSHGGSDHRQHHHRPFTKRGGPHNGGRPHMPPPPPPPPYVHIPQFIRPAPPPPAGTVPFVGPPPPPVHPFVPPSMGFPEMASPVYYVTGPPPLPFVAAPPVVHVVPPQAVVNAAVLKQIEYYFSNDNLCRDEYLRKHMDKEGWVSVSLIAGFNRVRQITFNIPNSISYILDLVRTSEIVEVDVQGEKLRRRGDWRTWILPSLPDTQTEAGGSNENMHG